LNAIKLHISNYVKPVAGNKVILQVRPGTIYANLGFTYGVYGQFVIHRFNPSSCDKGTK